MKNLTVRTTLALLVTLIISACDSKSPTNPSSSTGPAVGSPPTSNAKSGGGAPPQVSAADPSTAEQGSVNLAVTITGKNFNDSAVARFFVTGTTNPGGITVNSTAFVTSKKLMVNLDVDDLAVVDNFDIEVELSSGRKGKGTEKFSVFQKGGGGQTEDTFTVAMTIGNGTTSVFDGVGSGGSLAHAGDRFHLDLSDVGILPPCEVDFENFRGIFNLDLLSTGMFMAYYAIQLEGGGRKSKIGYGLEPGPGGTGVWDDPVCGLPTAGSVTAGGVPCDTNTVRDGEAPSEVEMSVKKSNKSGCATTIFEKVWSIVVTRTSNL